LIKEKIIFPAADVCQGSPGGHDQSFRPAEPRAVDQKTVFDAATLFMRTEEILPAPEPSHAITAAIQEALRAREDGRETVILFNLSGHGFLDIRAFSRNRGGHPRPALVEPQSGATFCLPTRIVIF
jgi:tryptophan synthase beta subunit